MWFYKHECLSRLIAKDRNMSQAATLFLLIKNQRVYTGTERTLKDVLETQQPCLISQIYVFFSNGDYQTINNYTGRPG